MADEVAILKIKFKAPKLILVKTFRNDPCDIAASEELTLTVSGHPVERGLGMVKKQKSNKGQNLKYHE